MVQFAPSLFWYYMQLDTYVFTEDSFVFKYPNFGRPAKHVCLHGILYRFYRFNRLNYFLRCNYWSTCFKYILFLIYWISFVLGNFFFLDVCLSSFIQVFHLKIEMRFGDAINTARYGVSFCGHYQIVVLGKTTCCDKKNYNRNGGGQNPFLHNSWVLGLKA